MTVNADDDCMAMVITAPSINPFNGWSVIFSSITSRRLPATFFREADSTLIPKRKKAKPPITTIMLFSPIFPPNKKSPRLIDEGSKYPNLTFIDIFHKTLLNSKDSFTLISKVNKSLYVEC